MARTHSSSWTVNMSSSDETLSDENTPQFPGQDSNPRQRWCEVNVPNWRVEDIDGGLAADFDGSLSGLGVELGAAAYNMSEALMALPVFKQENMENGLEPQDRLGQLVVRELDSPKPWATKSLLISGNPSRFQYVLGAATSPATKIHEETLTYLNQGQSYEVKLKKLGDLSEFREKLLKSVVKVCFHERRLQYMEKEQIAFWKSCRPGERILDIDIPLSYGVYDIRTDLNALNKAEFLWDPTKEAGVFFQVHCISTEFTPKKHGGEKGVPFRIQVDTYSVGEGEPRHLHSASCQVKVFKPKGADRKHKTDRDKMEKRSVTEQEKYQPSYDCTVLTENISVKTREMEGIGGAGQKECALDSVYSSPPAVMTPQRDHIYGSTSELDGDTMLYTTKADLSFAYGRSPTSSSCGVPSPSQPEGHPEQPLQAEANAQQTAQWLQQQRFHTYVRVFNNFCGADLLRLSRDDLTQICGLADGIRLYNALHSRAIRPRLTIYVCLESEQGEVYHAVYMENLTCTEMMQKIALLFNISQQQIVDIYIQGPSGIHVLINDEVVRNITDETRYTIETLKDESSDSYRVLLKTQH